MLTGLSTVNEEDPDGNDPSGFAIHVRQYCFCFYAIHTLCMTVDMIHA